VFRAFSRLGPPITSHAEPVQFRAGLLTVSVDDSAWLTELTFLRPEMLTRLNRMLGAEMVRDVRLRHAPLQADAKPAPRPAAPPRLSPEKAQAIETWAADIKSDEIREAMMRAATWALGSA
jgi:hypothetical protein